MPKTVLLAAGAVALALAGAAMAGAVAVASAGSVYTFRATMAPKSETPRPMASAGARGAFAATVTDSGSTRVLRWKLTFSGLSGKAIGAHLHSGRPGVAGAVLVPLCGPCTTGQTGTVKISKDAVDALERGLAYVNVHTAKNQAGEIRGQVKLVGQNSVPSSTVTNPAPATTTPGNVGGDPAGGYGY